MTTASFHPVSTSLVSELKSFLDHCDRPEGAVYALFAIDPEGRLHYVCSSGAAFDGVSFPDEILNKPPGKADARTSPRVLAQPHQLETWVPGLPSEGAAIWQPLESESGEEGLLLLWLPHAENLAESAAIFDSAARLAEPLFRIWQNDRRHERRYRRLKALEELSLSVASSLSLEHVLAQAREAVIGPLAFDWAEIYVLDQQDESLRGTGGTGSTDPAERRVSLRDSSPLARVGAGLQEFYLSNPASSEGTPEGAAIPQAIVPLSSGGAIVGAICVDNRVSRKSIRQEHLRVLLPFAAHAGAAVYNALMHEQLKEHLHRAEDLERRRKHFERDVILSVTDGKLHLCERDEIECALCEQVISLELASAADVGVCRHALMQAALGEGLAADRRSDFELCLGEAATNCYQHAGGGTVQLYRCSDSLQIRITDSGPGIQSFLLPRATLLKGYSTATSLGMGFSLILSLTDRLYLSTSERGTDLVIVMGLHSTTEAEKIWDQLGLSHSEQVPELT